MGVEPASVHPYVCMCVCVCNTFKHEYLHNQQADRNKIYLKHHWGVGKVAVDFGLDRIGTLVSMATDSPHMIIMGKISLAL